MVAVKGIVIRLSDNDKYDCTAAIFPSVANMNPVVPLYLDLMWIFLEIQGIAVRQNHRILVLHMACTVHTVHPKKVCLMAETSGLSAVMVRTRHETTIKHNTYRTTADHQFHLMVASRHIYLMAVDRPVSADQTSHLMAVDTLMPVQTAVSRKCHQMAVDISMAVGHLCLQMAADHLIPLTEIDIPLKMVHMVLQKAVDTVMATNPQWEAYHRFHPAGAGMLIPVDLQFYQMLADHQCLQMAVDIRMAADHQFCLMEVD